MAAGLLHLDPWHLFTSYAQYIFVLSSYTNILNVYAFSNFNDLSQGHKRSRLTTSVTASGVSKRTSYNKAVVEEPDVPQAYIDAQPKATVKRALVPDISPERSNGSTADDEAKMFRIRLVGVYIFSNFFLCIFILNDSFKQLHWLGDSYWHKIWFLRVWLWASAGCLYFRYVGSCLDIGWKAWSFWFKKRWCVWIMDYG